MIVFPNCKINIGLQIKNKREDGFHDLETIFYPINLQDGLEIITNTEKEETSITISCIETNKDVLENNICIKAYNLLKKDFDLPPVKIHLHKTIPVGAGLGGGSADAAFTLMLLNKKFNLNITEEKLLAYSLLLGSDCPFFIKNKPCYAQGRGEILEEVSLDLSDYKLVIVNPGIHINTGWAFSQLKLKQHSFSLKEVIDLPVDNWKNNVLNDFEEPIFSAHPQIKECKEALYKQGALYASMSGSGSTLYGIFKKDYVPDFSFPEHYFVKVC